MICFNLMWGTPASTNLTISTQLLYGWYQDQGTSTILPLTTQSLSW